jgi:hypothetical protein
MLRPTLDTSSVIHGAQAQPYGPAVDELVELARQSRVGLWITTAFAVDQERAPADKHERNLAWLSDRPLIGTVPGPWRLGYSGLEASEGLGDDDGAATDGVLKEVLLPGKARTASRRKITDVQHLTAHLVAGHDAFVTSDHDDMLKRRVELRARTGIVIVDPAEAVQLANDQGT